MEQVLRKKDIILVPFPFTNQLEIKRRPALVISNDTFNDRSNDIIACAITSNVDSDYSIYIKPDDWKDGLYSVSCIKFANIFTIEKKIVLKKIGRLSSERFNEVSTRFNEIVK